jgi:transposase-like protein
VNSHGRAAGYQDAKWEAAINALLTTGTITEAAQTVKISKTTLYKWLNQPDFQERYQTARRQAVDQAAAQL